MEGNLVLNIQILSLSFKLANLLEFNIELVLIALVWRRHYKATLVMGHPIQGFFSLG